MSKKDFDNAKIAARENPTLASLIMAAMLTANGTDLSNLRQVFPGIWTELKNRKNSRDGTLPEDPKPAPKKKDVKKDDSKEGEGKAGDKGDKTKK